MISNYMLPLIIRYLVIIKGLWNVLSYVFLTLMNESYERKYNWINITELFVCLFGFFVLFCFVLFCFDVLFVCLFVFVATPRVLSSASNIQLKLDGTWIKRSISVKNMGVTFDGSMNMSIHISKSCEIGNFHINNLWRMCRVITHDACHCAVRALVLSRIDYAKMLLLVPAELIANGCNVSRIRLPGWFLHVDATGALPKW